MIDARSNSYAHNGPLSRAGLNLPYCRKNRPFKVVVCAITLVAFIANIISYDLAWADSPATPAESVTFKELNPDNFILPVYLGTIKDSYLSEHRKPNTKNQTIIHIQDAHCNYYAQHKISEIIEYFNKEYGVNTINLEGGARDYDISIFTDIKDKKIRGRAADYFVKEGVVNGAEYFAINNPEKITLWGMEDVRLYIDNLKAYRNSLKYKDEVDRYLKNLNYILSNLKLKIYSKELLELDSRYNAYKANNADFKDYLGYLLEKAKNRLIDIKSYTNIYLLNQTLDQEAGIDFRRANNERDELIDKLQKRLSKNALEELVLKTVEFKAERVSQADFYRYLANKAKSISLKLDDFPELAKYSVYVSTYQAIDKSKIMDEVASLEDKLKALLFANDKDIELDILSKNLALMKNMFNISLTRDDYEYYQANIRSFEMRNFAKFIGREAPLYKIQAKLDENIARLDDFREDMCKFYEFSFKRDSVFIDNVRLSVVGSRLSPTPAKTENLKPKTAIIVTGGFHTENLTKMFKKHGISYVSIIPNFKNCDGYECPYFKILSGEKNLWIKDALPSVLNRSLATLDELSPAMLIGAKEAGLPVPAGIGEVGPVATGVAPKEPSPEALNLKRRIEIQQERVNKIGREFFSISKADPKELRRKTGIRNIVESGKQFFLVTSANMTEALSDHIEISVTTAEGYSDDELAWLIGHEFGHTQLGHPIDALYGKKVPNYQANELSADRVAVFLMAQAGFNLDGAISAVEKTLNGVRFTISCMHTPKQVEARKKNIYKLVREFESTSRSSAVGVVLSGPSTETSTRDLFGRGLISEQITKPIDVDRLFEILTDEAIASGIKVVSIDGLKNKLLFVVDTMKTSIRESGRWKGFFIGLVSIFRIMLGDSWRIHTLYNRESGIITIAYYFGFGGIPNNAKKLHECIHVYQNLLMQKYLREGLITHDDMANLMSKNWETIPKEFGGSYSISKDDLGRIEVEIKDAISSLPPAPSAAQPPGGLCVTADTLLTLKDGRQIPIVRIKAGDYVMSLNETTRLVEPHRVIGLLDMGVKPVYKLTTASGRSIKTTANHPYLTREGWVKVSGLRTGEEIAVPPVSREPLRNPQSDKGEIAETFVRSGIFQRFDLRKPDGPFHRMWTNSSGPGTGNDKGMKPGKDLLAFWTAYLPVNIFPPHTTILSCGYFFTSFSRFLLIKESLSNIFAFIFTPLIADNEISMLSILFPKLIYHAAMKMSSCFTSATVWAEEMGGGDILWDKIVSIEPLGPRHVYDIEVEGTHNFIGNGIFAHNTIIPRAVPPVAPMAAPSAAVASAAAPAEAAAKPAQGEAKPLSDDEITYGWFDPAKEEVVIDREKAKNMLKNSSIEGAQGLPDHKLTVFVHCHEVFHELVKKLGITTTEDEEVLANQFAAFILGSRAPPKVENDIPEPLRKEIFDKITDPSLIEQVFALFASPYGIDDSGAFLLAVHRLHININNVRLIEQGETIPAGAKAMAAPAGAVDDIAVKAREIADAYPRDGFRVTPLSPVSEKHYNIFEQPEGVMRLVRGRNWYLRNKTQEEASRIIARGLNSFRPAALEKMKEWIVKQLEEEGYSISKEKITAMVSYGSYWYSDDDPSDLDIFVVVRQDGIDEMLLGRKIDQAEWFKMDATRKVGTVDLKVVSENYYRSRAYEVEEDVNSQMRDEAMFWGHGIIIDGIDYWANSPTPFNLIQAIRQMIYATRLYLDDADRDYALRKMNRRWLEAKLMFDLLFSDDYLGKGNDEMGYAQIQAIDKEMTQALAEDNRDLIISSLQKALQELLTTHIEEGLKRDIPNEIERIRKLYSEPSAAVSALRSHEPSRGVGEEVAAEPAQRPGTTAQELQDIVDRYVKVPVESTENIPPEIMMIFDAVEKLRNDPKNPIDLQVILTGGTARDFAVATRSKIKLLFPSTTDYDIAILLPPGEEEIIYHEDGYKRLEEAFKQKLIQSGYPEDELKDLRIDFIPGVKIEGTYVFENLLNTQAGNAFSISRLGVAKINDKFTIFGLKEAVGDLIGFNLKLWIQEGRTPGPAMSAKMLGKASIYSEVAGFALDSDIREKILQDVREVGKSGKDAIMQFMQDILRYTQLAGKNDDFENRLKKTITLMGLDAEFRYSADELITMASRGISARPVDSEGRVAPTVMTGLSPAPPVNIFDSEYMKDAIAVERSNVLNRLRGQVLLDVKEASQLTKDEASDIARALMGWIADGTKYIPHRNDIADTINCLLDEDYKGRLSQVNGNKRRIYFALSSRKVNGTSLRKVEGIVEIGEDIPAMGAVSPAGTFITWWQISPEERFKGVGEQLLWHVVNKEIKTAQEMGFRFAGTKAVEALEQKGIQPGVLVPRVTLQKCVLAQSAGTLAILNNAKMGDTGAVEILAGIQATVHPVALPAAAPALFRPSGFVGQAAKDSAIADYLGNLYASSKELVSGTNMPDTPRFFFIPLSRKLCDVANGSLQGKVQALWKSLRDELRHKYRIGNINIIFYDGTIEKLEEKMAAQKEELKAENTVIYIDGTDRPVDAYKEIADKFYTIREVAVKEGRGYISIGGHVALGLGILELHAGKDHGYYSKVIDALIALSYKKDHLNKYKKEEVTVADVDQFLQDVKNGNIEITLPPIREADIDENMRDYAAAEEAAMRSL
ncbi:MAG: hypothetical protein V1927_01520 [Candidatus Omnitrophota bacterium]